MLKNNGSNTNREQCERVASMCVSVEHSFKREQMLLLRHQLTKKERKKRRINRILSPLHSARSWDKAISAFPSHPSQSFVFLLFSLSTEL